MFKKPQSAFSILISIFFVGLFGFSLNVNAGGSSTITVGDTAHIYWNVAGGPTDSCSPSTSYPNVDTVYTSWTGPASYALVGDKDLGVVTRANPSPGWTFTCTNNGVPDTTTLVVNCLPGYVWDNGICNPADASFTGTPTCTIASNGAGCSSSISWTASYVDSVDLTDCSGGFYARTGSGSQTSSVYIPYNTGCYQIRKTSDQSVLATVNGSASCISGTAWNGAVCIRPTGTFTSSVLGVPATSCTIAIYQRTCTLDLNWTTSYPFGASAITSTTHDQELADLGDSGKVSDSGTHTLTLPGDYTDNTFFLYNNANILGPQTGITITKPTCVTGTGWDPASRTCVPPPVATLEISNNVDYLNNNTQTAFAWSQTGVTDSCTSPDGSIGSILGANPTKNPLGDNGLTGLITVDKTYQYQCTGPGGVSNLATLTIKVLTGPIPPCVPGTPSCTDVNNKVIEAFVCPLATPTYNSLTNMCIAGPGAQISASSPISNGATTNIHWDGSSADSCTASAGDAGWVSSNPLSGVTGNYGTQALTNNTTYSVKCTGPTGIVSQTKSVVVTVCQAPTPIAFGGVCISGPTATLSSLNDHVSYGDNVELKWVSTNANSCSPGITAWSNATPPIGDSLNGQGQTDALTSAQNFTFQCTGDGGTSPISTVTANVLPANCTGAACNTCTGPSCINICNQSSPLWDETTGRCYGNPTASLTVTDGTVSNGIHFSYGDLATLTWSSTGATTCNTPGNVPANSWSPGISTSGTANTGSLTSPKTFSLRCTNPVGTSSTVTVPVTEWTAACVPANSCGVTYCPQAQPTWTGTTCSASAPTATLTLGDTHVSNGAGTSLVWASTNSETCTAGGGYWNNLPDIDNPNKNPLMGSGFTGLLENNSPTLEKIYTYTFSCKNAAGEDSNFESKTVTVCPLNSPGWNGSACTVDVAVDINALPQNINYGSSTNLSWQSSGAETCRATVGDNLWMNPLAKGTSSSYETPNLTVSTKYGITCTRAGYLKLNPTSSTTVKVCGQASPIWDENSGTCVKVPTVTFAAKSDDGGTNFSYGDRANLTWHANDATDCIIGGDWGAGSSKFDGSGLSNPIISVQTFTYQCTGPGGTSDLISVTIDPFISTPCPIDDSTCHQFCPVAQPTWNGSTCVGVPVVDITATKTNVNYGSSTTLTWSSTGAEHCSAYGPWINNAPGKDPLNDNGLTNSLITTTTFSFQCTNISGNSEIASTTVNVCPKATPYWDGSACSIVSTTAELTIDGSNDAHISFGAQAAIDWGSEGVECHPNSDTGYDSAWNTSGATFGSGFIPDYPNDTNVTTNPTNTLLTLKYGVKCTNTLGGAAAAEATLTICPSETPVWVEGNGDCEDTIGASLSVSSGHVSYNDSADLSWWSARADSCSPELGNSTWTSLGSIRPNEAAGISTGPLTVDTTYRLRCTGSLGTRSDTVSVTVCPIELPTWDGLTCTGSTFNFDSDSCVIADGESKCEMDINWVATGQVGAITITRDYDSNSVFKSGQSGNEVATFDYNDPVTNPAWNMSLREAGVVKKTAQFVASCAPGSGWDGTKCKSLSGTLNPNSCIILEDQSSCTMGVVWSVTDPSGIITITSSPSTVSIPVPANTSSGAPSITFPYRATPYALTLKSGANTLKQNVNFITSCISGTVWDSRATVANPNGSCVKPKAIMTTNPDTDLYTSNQRFLVTCVNSKNYSITGPNNASEVSPLSGTIASLGVVSGSPFFPKNNGYYTLTCSNGPLSATARLEAILQPPSPSIIINAVPKTIQKGTETTISWTINFPPQTGRSCTLDAKVVCVTNCSSESVTGEAARVNSLLTGQSKTDANDPNGNRSITGANGSLNTILSHSHDPWEAKGQKTILLNNSADFTIDCSPNSAPGTIQKKVRVQVANSTEG